MPWFQPKLARSHIRKKNVGLRFAYEADGPRGNQGATPSGDGSGRARAEEARGGRGAAAAAVRGWTPRLGSGGPAAVRGEGRASGREAAAQRSEFWPKNQNSDFQNSDFKIRILILKSEF